MPKVYSDKFKKMTEGAVCMAGRMLRLLYLLECPDEKEYMAIDEVVTLVQEMRVEFGLPEVDPKLLFHGERPKKKGPLGFQLPEAEDKVIPEKDDCKRAQQWREGHARTCPPRTPRPCDCGSGEESYWALDGNGIELERVCSQCKERKLAKYRPEIVNSPYTQADVDEPIEPED